MTPHLGRLAAAATSVLQELFADDEIEQIRLAKQLGGTDQDEPEVLFVVTARGEESHHYLWRIGQIEESPEELKTRIASELQDFISESIFGWGEQRPWPPVPSG